MTAKKQKSNLTVVTLVATIFLIFSVIAITTPLSKLPLRFVNQEQRKIEPKWRLIANTYQTDWEYGAGTDHKGKIGFTVTVEGDVIKDVVTKVYTEVPQSRKMQTEFGQALPKLVVGKKLSEIANLDVVSGASGTTESFKEAIAELNRQNISGTDY